MKPTSFNLASRTSMKGGEPIVDLRANLEGRLERAKETLLEADPLSSQMIQFEISSLESDMARIDGQARAQGVLIFDGAPVQAGLGIEADFAAKALERFQEAVTLRGARAAKGAHAQAPPALIITGTVSGSFGFILEEVNAKDGMQFGESPLMQALDEIQSALSKAATGDKDSFIAALQELGGANEPLGSLLDLCWKERATLQMNTPRRSVSMSYQRVADGAAWHQEATQEEKPFSMRGTLSGLFTLSRTFEFLPMGAKNVIKGSIRTEVDPHSLAHLLDHEVDALFTKKTTRKRAKARAGNPVWVLEQASEVPQGPRLVE